MWKWTYGTTHSGSWRPSDTPTFCQKPKNSQCTAKNWLRWLEGSALSFLSKAWATFRVDPRWHSKYHNGPNGCMTLNWNWIHRSPFNSTSSVSGQCPKQLLTRIAAQICADLTWGQWVANGLHSNKANESWNIQDLHDNGALATSLKHAFALVPPFAASSASQTSSFH